jgi:adenylyltransferase/sulfurtransferase
MTADVTASLQAVEALKWLSGNRDAVQGTLVAFDLWNRRFREMPLPAPDPACPVCSRRSFPALEEDAEDAVVLCGREMVQVRTAGPFDLDEWAERLAPFARIERNAFLLRAALTEGETLVLFPDGRVLVRGTDDPGRARSLVARYLGA